MKKKISLLLCMLVTAITFTACGAKKETLEYDEATLQQATDFLIEYCASADEATVEQWKSMTDFAMESQLMQAGLPYTTESFIGALDAWPAAVDECGEYISHGDYTIEADNDEIKVTAPAEFKDREATLTFIYDENSRLETMTVDAKYSMGEILKKAGLNTVLGMGTVFAVLIFISILISLFKYIPMLENAFKKKSDKAVAEEKESAPVQAVQTAVKTADDSELIAVITAAIAAAEAEAGGQTDGFVVRSIRRRPSNKWKA